MIDLRNGAGLGAIVLVASLVVADTARANSGCCLQRQSDNAPWIEVGRDFEKCVERNAPEGDDVFAPTGLVWWNLTC
ncbi:MAG: hypothetical protein AAFV19_09130 [Pseudomonadota bacterium]